MPTPVLSFTLNAPLPVNVTVDDAAGCWQYAGTTATSSSGETVTLVATKRVNAAFGPLFIPSASILTAVVIFPTQDNATSDHITLQGLHDLTSNNEIGSVSAASPLYAAYIGGAFTFDFKTVTLTINPA